ncbi:Intimal thickness related receptor IRP domain-containing protein [Plasmodiophora brassicae]
MLARWMDARILGVIALLLQIVTAGIRIGNDTTQIQAVEFVFAAHPFNMRCRPVFLTDEMATNIRMPTMLPNATAVLINAMAYAKDYESWATLCESTPGCSAVVIHNHLSSFSPLSFESWTSRGSSSDGVFSTVPFMETATNLCDVIPSTTSTVVLQSGDVNEARVLYQSWTSRLIHSAICLANVIVIISAGSKLAGFYRAGTSIPVAVVFVTVPEIIASSMRFVYLANVAWYDAQGLPVRPVRYLVVGWISFTFTGMATMGFTLHGHLLQGAEWSRQRRITVTALRMLLIAFLLLDQATLIYLTVTLKVAITSGLNAAIYTLATVPLSLGFIKYGSAIATTLLRNESVLRIGPKSDRLRRRHFARRVVMSGICGIVTVASMVFYQFIYTRSLSAYVYALALGTACYTASGFLHVTAFQVRRSTHNSSAVKPLDRPS